MPNEFDKGMIASQLRNAGVLEAIRVSRVGFSQRFDHKVFVGRYRIIDVNNSGSVESLVNSIAVMVKPDDSSGERYASNMLLELPVQRYQNCTHCSLTLILISSL